MTCRAAGAEVAPAARPVALSIAIAVPSSELAASTERSGVEAPSAEPAAPPLPAPHLALNTPDANAEGWCLPGVDALDPETCVVVPDEIKPPRTLVIYLHGVVNPWSENHNRDYQLVVRDNARHRGFVAMIPRGRRGIGPDNARGHWAWPTTTDVYNQMGKEITRIWLEKKKIIEAGLGQPFEKTFLAGSSNGAYFLTSLALKGDFVADGFAALSGGTKGGWSRWTLGHHQLRAPFYVGYGTADDSSADPESLGELLRDVRWPSKVAVHVCGHGAQPIYLEEAVPFLGGP